MQTRAQWGPLQELGALLVRLCWEVGAGEAGLVAASSSVLLVPCSAEVLAGAVVKLPWPLWLRVAWPTEPRPTCCLAHGAHGPQVPCCLAQPGPCPKHAGAKLPWILAQPGPASVWMNRVQTATEASHTLWEFGPCPS